jgi:hypothetical protein
MAEEELSLNDLWKALQESGELILLIDKNDEDRTKRGLIKRKANQNSKLRQSGIEPIPQELEFHITPYPEDLSLIYFHCVLVDKEKILVYERFVPDDV